MITKGETKKCSCYRRSIVTKISKCLDITINNSSIEKCCRFNAIEDGIKPVLVVFNSMHDRDLLLSAYKMKKTILSTDIGCDGSNKIHVREHLTNLQRVLLKYKQTVSN